MDYLEVASAVSEVEGRVRDTVRWSKVLTSRAYEEINGLGAHRIGCELALKRGLEDCRNAVKMQRRNRSVPRFLLGWATSGVFRVF